MAKKELQTEDAILKLLDIYTKECEDTLNVEQVSEKFGAYQADMIEKLWYMKVIKEEAERISKLLKERMNEYYPEGAELEVNTERGVYSAKHNFRKGYTKPAIEVEPGYSWQFKRLYSLS